MKLIEAQELASRMNTHNATARVVRILDESIDPPQEHDNGWDVEVTVEDV